MKAASCFSGIGGAELALPEAEWLWCAEIENFPSAVLASRFGHPNLGDITAPDFIDRAKAFGTLDLLAGGPPCQAFSVAGLRKGMSDPRGQLSIRFLEIAHAIRPRNLLVENVPGWLNHEDNAFGCFLGGLVGADDALLPCERPRGRKGNEFWRWHEERQELVPTWPSSGMVAGPWARAAWRILDAQYAGLAQRRERVFLVADFGDGADPVEILFERQSLSGNYPPRRETGQGFTHDLAPCLTSGGGRGTERAGDTRGQDPAIAVPIGFGGGGNTSGPIDVAACLTAKGQRVDFEVETFLAEPAHTLRAEGFDASEDGTGRGTPIVPVAYPREISPTITTNYGKQVDSSDTSEGPNVVPVCFNSREDPCCYGDVAGALGSSSPQAQAVAFDLRGREGGAQFEGPHDTANIRAASGGSSRSYVAEQWAVRRLTPTECERLQGYPDGHTLIEFGSRRTVEEDEAAYLMAHGAHVICDNESRFRTNAAADGPRYKGLGNAWAVKCVRPIAKRIMERQAA